MEENFSECNVLHEEIVKKVKQKMPEDGFIYDLAELFKVFADSTRMKIIYALLEEELCVCDIANICRNYTICNITPIKVVKTIKISKIQKRRKNNILQFG